MSQDHFDQLYPMRVEMEKKKPQNSSATQSNSNNTTHSESPTQPKQNDLDLSNWHQERHEAEALEEAKRNAYHAACDEDDAIQRKKYEIMGQEWQEKRKNNENREKTFFDVYKDYKEEQQKKDLERENFNKKYTE